MSETVKARLTVGDWSQDGHNETDVIDVLIPLGLKAADGKWDQAKAIKQNQARASTRTWGCSATPDLWFYYELAIESGLPALTAYCADYEDASIPEEDFKEIIEKLGSDDGDWDYDMWEEDGENFVQLDTEIYAELWIAYVNHGIKLNGEDLKVQSFKEVKIKTLNYNIGGYGLLGG